MLAPIKTNIKPMYDKIFLRKLDPEQETASGLILPETRANNHVLKAEVLAVGKGERHDDGEFLPIDLSVGDIVLYAPGSGITVDMDGHKYFILPEKQVLAVLKEDKVIPYGDVVLCKRIGKDKTAGGLFLPSEDKTEVEILAVGSGERVGKVRKPLEVKVGDRAYLKQWSGFSLQFEPDTKIVKIEVIYCAIEREEV